MGAVGWNRLQFAFTITYHYLFPQLTMGLALLLVVMKAIALYTRVERWNDLARFWGRVFGINFGVGVVTGIPMEFQLGTNWARFSDVTGGVIGLTLAMEGLFAFFAESAFLGLFLFGEKKLGPRGHFVAGLVACVVLLFPTGDQHGKLVAEHQPVALAAMEGKFESSTHAELAIFGQPNVEERRLENPVVVPSVLSFLAYGSFGAEVRGLDDAPRDQWPDNVELVYYAYHVMVGLGTLLLGLMAVSAFLLWRGALHRTRGVLWALMLAFPFPYIATTAGWMTAELGRQPWIVYGLQRTALATSPRVGAGDVAFSTIGYMGLYFVVGALFLFLVGREIARGPEPQGG
jgi:cytochrome d ubiquinol oxidase subunit I